MGKVVFAISQDLKSVSEGPSRTVLGTEFQILGPPNVGEVSLCE